MPDTSGARSETDRREATGATREGLWAAIAAGLEALLGATSPSDSGASATARRSASTAEACAAKVARWVRTRTVLGDGTAVDRHLVEALLEAESALLVHAGEATQRVAVARRRFEDLSLGTLVPATGS